MKDTFGGTIMIYLLMFFLSLYIVFIALALRFAQSFRVKNKLIDSIEANNGVSDVILFKDEILPYLEKLSVTPAGVDIAVIPIEEINVPEKCYYTVKSFVSWKWPFLNVEGKWVIKGETKNVINCSDVDILPSDYGYDGG